MQEKCLIPACTSNYGPWKNDSMKAKHYVKVFRLPKKPADMKVWIRALSNRDQNVNSNSVICAKHCPENYPTAKLRCKERPRNHPSIWPLARCP